MEPKLENIEDYYTLKGSKKKVVLTVIAIGIFLGLLINYFNATTSVDDELINEKSYSKLPPKY